MCGANSGKSAMESRMPANGTAHARPSSAPFMSLAMAAAGSRRVAVAAATLLMDKVTMETPWGDRLSAGRRLKMAYVGRCGRKRFPGAEAPTVLSNVHRVTKYLRMQTYTDFLIPAELSEVSLQMRGPLSRKDWKMKGAGPRSAPFIVPV